MKLLAPFVIALILGCLSLPAEQATGGNDRALEQTLNEERYKNLISKINTLQESYDVLVGRLEKTDQRIRALTDEVEKLKERHNRAGANQVTPEQLKDVVDQLRKVEENRQADTKWIRDKLDKLDKLAKAPLTPPAEPKRQNDAQALPENVVLQPQEVPAGATLSEIAKTYNEGLKNRGSKRRITVPQILRANPGLKPETLQACQKILIPLPKD